jgi:F0F1-type ATP synthase assembly protein I
MRSVQLRYAGLGFEFAGGILGFVLLGYWVDRSFGTQPYGVLAGSILGLIGGTVHLVRRGLGLQQELARMSESKRPKTGSENENQHDRP